MGQNQSEVITKTILVMGDTRVGKDSLINTVAGEVIAKEGLRNYKSTTKDVETYTIDIKNYHITVINMPGFKDTDLSFTDEELMKKLEIEFVDKSVSEEIDAILLLDSLTTEGLKYRQYLKHLTVFFGQDITNTCVCIATKRDFANNNISCQKKMKDMEIECKKLNLPFMNWESNTRLRNIDPSVRKSQIDNLNKLISQVRTYQLQGVHEIQQQIQDIAYRLMHEAPIENKTQVINFYETEIEPKLVKKSRSIKEYIYQPTISKKEVNVVKEVDEEYTENEITVRQAQSTHRQYYFFKLFRKSNTYYHNEYDVKQVKKIRKVLVLDKELVDVKKDGWIEQETPFEYNEYEFKQKEVERQFNVQIQIQKQIESYFLQAKQIWLDKQIKSLRKQ